TLVATKSWTRDGAGQDHRRIKQLLDIRHEIWKARSQARYQAYLHHPFATYGYEGYTVEELRAMGIISDTMFLSSCQLYPLECGRPFDPNLGKPPRGIP
ncbi:unnamed protein product, partial [marine sediment metagenome]